MVTSSFFLALTAALCFLFGAEDEEAEECGAVSPFPLPFTRLGCPDFRLDILTHSAAALQLRRL